MSYPQLCATGTVGVAAVGLAFGHPQHPVATRPMPKKRRIPSRAGFDDSTHPSSVPATPTPLAQVASVPTSRLRKRTSVGRSLTPSTSLRGGVKTLDSTSGSSSYHGSEDQRIGEIPMQRPDHSGDHGPFGFEFRGSENTPPNWLRRMSTLSSLRTGSPAPTSRPHSSSISYSNGSTAPILPNVADSGHGTSSRNKLVKRSSSQRALYGSNALHSTLRRPATSHQRSATFQQQYLQEEGSIRPSVAASSILPNDLSEDHQLHWQSLQLWQPFFKPRISGTLREESSRRRPADGIANRNESPTNIVPGINKLPTLLSATSISSASSNELANGRSSNISALSSPFTPVGMDNFSASARKNTKADVITTPELKPRHSFPLSEIFSSPSPSAWIPRFDSLRKNKGFSKDAGGRRVVSVPQNSKARRNTSLLQGQDSIESRAASHRIVDSPASPLEGRIGPARVQQRGSSSPLPPLNRLSGFEIDLSDTNPSYPTTAQSENAMSPRAPSAHSSLSMSSPPGPIPDRTRLYRFSSAPSDRGSTLLGSDNDNSRLISGDDDDLDSRSGTMYDSTRTGATGSSHSGARRPPIDTIFDESAPKLPSKEKLVALQDLLNEDSFIPSPHFDPNALEEEQEVLTPVRHAAPRKEDDSPTPMHDPSEFSFSPRISPSPLFASLEIRTIDRPPPAMENEQEDELWSFGNTDETQRPRTGAMKTPFDDGSSPSSASVSRDHYLSHRRRESPSNGRLDNSSKANVFEWSEQPTADKDISQGDSLRPKTVHGRQGVDTRGSRTSGRRGPSALHLRSQSVPVPTDVKGHRTYNNPSKLDSWVLGNKGPSEDWDGDFDFDEPSHAPKQEPASSEQMRPSLSSGMLVPRAILERQASVHGQFGQVKELTLLVEELKRLQQQASGQGIMEGQSSELWKEAEGIINLATLDDEEQELFPQRSPHSPNFDFDLFDDESPLSRSRRRSGFSPPPKEDRMSAIDDSSGSPRPPKRSHDVVRLETPPPTSRPRKESSAKAKSVLEIIHQQRKPYDPELLDPKFAQKKLPFDTTSLKDLVTRAGVVTRALKEIVRRAENGVNTPEPLPGTPKDPLFSQMFRQPPVTPPISKGPHMSHSPKSLRSPRSSTCIGGSIAGNDNDINGHMKMMTVA